ncbi:hypothetical protein FJZ39_04025 [Candidatus Saccharibacteria bacterium]|nr:hypothetical protein [Candidatus Saccharibacteria bacterium]
MGYFDDVKNIYRHMREQTETKPEPVDSSRSASTPAAEQAEPRVQSVQPQSHASALETDAVFVNGAWYERSSDSQRTEPIPTLRDNQASYEETSRMSSTQHQHRVANSRWSPYHPQDPSLPSTEPRAYQYRENKFIFSFLKRVVGWGVVAATFALIFLLSFWSAVFTEGDQSGSAFGIWVGLIGGVVCGLAIRRTQINYRGWRLGYDSTRIYLDKAQSLRWLLIKRPKTYFISNLDYVDVKHGFFSRLFGWNNYTVTINVRGEDDTKDLHNLHHIKDGWRLKDQLEELKSLIDQNAYMRLP